MNRKNQLVAIPDEVVMNKIYLKRDKKVMLDRDLAELYGVETGLYLGYTIAFQVLKFM